MQGNPHHRGDHTPAIQRDQRGLSIPVRARGRRGTLPRSEAFPQQLLSGPTVLSIDDEVPGLRSRARATASRHLARSREPSGMRR